jgi:glycosyltransferase involved in cell wall biosynthesis
MKTVDEPVRPPSVVHISAFGSPYSGNFIASLRTLDGALRSQGWRLAYVLPNSASQWPWFAELSAAGARIHVISGRRNLLATALSLVRIARRDNGLILHTHFSSFDVSASAARFLLKLMGHDVRVVWHYHSPYGPDTSLRRRTKDFVKLRIFGAGAYALAVTELIRDEIVHRGFNARHADWLLNGVDLRRPASPGNPREEVRQELGVTPTTTAALLFGWDPFRKGVDVAVDAVRKLTSSGREVVLLVVGEQATREFILQHCGGSIPEFVRLAPPRECVADLYGAADVFLSVGRAEGMTYSLGEAMAASLPVIVSDIPGQGWMRGSQGPLFVPSGDADAVVTAVEKLIRMPASERDVLCRANREVSGNISVERWAVRLCDFYQRVLRAESVAGADGVTARVR